MPIAQNITYKCPKCGYTTTITRGDVIYSPAELSPPTCPKCNIKMKEIDNTNIIEILLNIFGKKTK